MQTNLPSRLAKRQGNNTAAPAKPATAAKPAQAEARTMSQKPMSSEKPDKAPKIQSVFGKDCAILLGESLTPVVVAKALDKNSLISAKLRILRPQDCDPFLGYTIEVDLEDQARNEALGFGVRYDCRRAELDVEVATKHVINVKFPRDITIVVEDARQALPNYSEIFSGSKYSEAAVVHITIPENSDEPIVEGFGLPFSDHKNPQLEGWLHGNQPITVGFSLVNLIRQKKMSFFMDLSVHVVNKKFFEQPLPEPFKLPYQTVGAKFEDYREPVKMHQGHQFMPRFVLDSDDDHNIVVNHAVVQDMLWIYEAAHEIKRMKRPVYFAALDKPSADREKKFYVIVSLLDDFRAAYGDAWRRLTRYFGRVEVSFYDSETSSSDPCEEWDGTIIENPESIPRFVECHKPDAEKELVMLIEPSKRPCKKSALIRRQNWATIFINPEAHEIKRKIASTDRFLSTSRPANVAGWNLPGQLPTAVQLQNQATVMDLMHLHRVFVRGAGFWEWQMSGGGEDVPRSLPVLNFLEFGNRALATAIVQEALPEDRARWANYLQRRPLGFGIISAAPGTGKTTMMASAVLAMAARLGKVLCSAPANVALTNFAERIYKRSCAVVERYKANNTGNKLPPYRRLTVVRGYKLEFELVATKALLQDPSLGDAAVPDHMVLDHANSRWKLHLSPTYWLLMVLGSSAVRKLEHDDGAGLWALRNLPCEGHMARLRAVARGEMSWAAFNEGLEKEQFARYIGKMLEYVDVLCLTPAASHYGREYAMWKHWHAKAIAIDEAGNMLCADLYDVWGNTMQPCFLGGDHQQLPPTVLSSMDNVNGEYRNRFAKYGKISALLKFQAMGMPVYRLNQQLRMAKGMFDIPSKVIYPDVPFTYSRSCDISRPEFKIGRDLESYLRRVFPRLAAPPHGRVRPVFLHCPRSETVQDKITGSSRMNSEQVTIALNAVAGFIKASRADPARISILSPYAANVAEIKQQLKEAQYKPIRGMPSPSTVDSFQGQENDIIVLVMGTTVASGPGFTADPARLNVAMTRPRSGLVIVGDVNAAGQLMESDGRLSENSTNKTFEFIDSEGNRCIRKAPALRSVLGTLVREGRVVTVV
ncbi:hypothetical protein MY4824_001998 [Beauveria thailandica]